VYSVATAFGTALVLDRYHYVSDVLAGASLGVAVGRYVVRQRSSRFETVDGVPRRKVELVPTMVPTRDGAAPGGALRVDL
jgi:membrane-associated phospholipid phosphatase